MPVIAVISTSAAIAIVIAISIYKLMVWRRRSPGLSYRSPSVDRYDVGVFAFGICLMVFSLGAVIVAMQVPSTHLHNLPGKLLLMLAAIGFFQLLVFTFKPR